MNFDIAEEANGLVALLGWDLSNFQQALPGEPVEVLLETMLVLEEPAEPNEPKYVQERADIGHQMIKAELQRRQERKIKGN